MSGANFYLLASLPTLGEPGSDPPLSLEEYLDRVAEAPKCHAEAAALFLGDDLRQREALLAGEIDQPAGTVLTDAQLRDDEPLPPFLVGEEPDEPAGGRLQTDRLWEVYLRYLAHLARSSGFLTAWLAHEVGLRNALAAARAKALDLEAGAYLVSPERGLPADEFETVLAEWSAAADPLAGLRALDAARWAYLVAHDAWFTFADDELAAYAAKLMLLHRWKRIDSAARDRRDGADSNAAREESP